jgi:hypothetical protein
MPTPEVIFHPRTPAMESGKPTRAPKTSQKMAGREKP